MMKQTSDKLKIPQKDALVVLALDDFWDYLKSAGKKVFDSVKKYHNQNPELVKDVLTGIIKNVHPVAGKVLDTAWNALGGPLQS